MSTCTACGLALFDADYVCSGIELLCILHPTVLIQCRKSIAVVTSSDFNCKVSACMAVLGTAADGLLKQCVHASPL